MKPMVSDDNGITLLLWNEIYGFGWQRCNVAIGIKDLHFYNSDDFNAIINNCDIEDSNFDYESELKLLIISICEYGFMYLPKKTLSGKSQYNGNKVVNEDEEEENSKEKDHSKISNDTDEKKTLNESQIVDTKALNFTKE